MNDEPDYDAMLLDDVDEMTACRMLLVDMGYTPGEPYTPEPDDADAPF